MAGEVLRSRSVIRPSHGEGVEAGRRRATLERSRKGSTHSGGGGLWMQRRGSGQTGEGDRGRDRIALRKDM